MPKFFHLTRIQKRKVKRKRNNGVFSLINYKAFNTVVFGSLIVIFLFYLIQINSLATKGYIISELEQDLLSLKKRSSTLEAQVLTLQTTNGMGERLEDLGMVTTANVEYLKVKQPVVAYK